MDQVNMSEVENPEGRALHAVAEAHAAFLKEHLTSENLQKWGDAGKLKDDGAGLLTSALNAERYMAMSDDRRKRVDQIIKDIQEEAVG